MHDGPTMHESVAGLLRDVATELADGRGIGSESVPERPMPDAQVPSSTIAALVGGFLEAAPDGMVVTDVNGIIQVANTQAERMLGYSSGELVGLPIERLIPADLRARHVHHRTAYNAQPTTRRM